MLPDIRGPKPSRFYAIWCQIWFADFSAGFDVGQGNAPCLEFQILSWFRCTLSRCPLLSPPFRHFDNLNQTIKWMSREHPCWLGRQVGLSVLPALGPPWLSEKPIVVQIDYGRSAVFPAVRLIRLLFVHLLFSAINKIIPGLAPAPVLSGYIKG